MGLVLKFKDKLSVRGKISAYLDKEDNNMFCILDKNDVVIYKRDCDIITTPKFYINISFNVHIDTTTRDGDHVYKINDTYSIIISESHATNGSKEIILKELLPFDRIKLYNQTPIDATGISLIIKLKNPTTMDFDCYSEHNGLCSITIIQPDGVTSNTYARGASALQDNTVYLEVIHRTKNTELMYFPINDYHDITFSEEFDDDKIQIKLSDLPPYPNGLLIKLHDDISNNCTFDCYSIPENKGYYIIIDKNNDIIVSVPDCEILKHNIIFLSIVDIDSKKPVSESYMGKLNPAYSMLISANCGNYEYDQSLLEHYRECISTKESDIKEDNLYGLIVKLNGKIHCNNRFDCYRDKDNKDTITIIDNENNILHRYGFITTNNVVYAEIMHYDDIGEFNKGYALDNYYAITFSKEYSKNKIKITQSELPMYADSNSNSNKYEGKPKYWKDGGEIYHKWRKDNTHGLPVYIDDKNDENISGLTIKLRDDIHIDCIFDCYRDENKRGSLTIFGKHNDIIYNTIDNYHLIHNNTLFFSIIHSDDITNSDIIGKRLCRLNESYQLMICNESGKHEITQSKLPLYKPNEHNRDNKLTCETANSVIKHISFSDYLDNMNKKNKNNDIFTSYKKEIGAYGTENETIYNKGDNKMKYGHLIRDNVYLGIIDDGRKCTLSKSQNFKDSVINKMKHEFELYKKDDNMLSLLTTIFSLYKELHDCTDDEIVKYINEIEDIKGTYSKHVILNEYETKEDK